VTFPSFAVSSVLCIYRHHLRNNSPVGRYHFDVCGTTWNFIFLSDCVARESISIASRITNWVMVGIPLLNKIKEGFSCSVYDREWQLECDWMHCWFMSVVTS